MSRIAVQFYGTILDAFELSAIDHISVFKPNNLETLPENVGEDVEVHMEHLGEVAKSGRILEVYCVEPESKKCKAYFYNADRVILGPVE